MESINPGVSVNAASAFKINEDSYSKGGWGVLVIAGGKGYKVGIN